MKKQILIFIFLLILPTVLAGQRQNLYDIAMNIQHYDNRENDLWNENSTLNINGSIVGNPAINNSVHKIGEGSLRCDDGDRISFNGTDPRMTTVKNFTYCVWINHTASGTVDRIATRIGVGGGEAGDWQFIYDDRAGSNNYKSIVYGSAVDMTITYSVSDYNVNHFVCLSINDTGTTYGSIYYDGNIVATSSFSGAFSTTTNNLTICNDDGSPDDQAMFGFLDESNYFNRSLNESDLDFLYNNGAGINLTPEESPDTTPPVAPSYDPIAVHLNGTEIINGFKTFLNNTVFTIANFTQINVGNIFGGNFFGNKIEASNVTAGNLTVLGTSSSSRVEANNLQVNKVNTVNLTATGLISGNLSQSSGLPISIVSQSGETLPIGKNFTSNGGIWIWWGKGTVNGTKAFPRIRLNLNGIMKDEIVTKQAAVHDAIPFSLMFTEQIPAGPHSVNITTTAGTLGRLKLIGMEIR